MDISKIKELEAALRNQELGSPNCDPGPKGSAASASLAYNEGRHIYSITVEADYAGRTRATVHTQQKFLNVLLRDNPGAITWKSKWPDGKEFRYVKVNNITYMCIRRTD